MNQGQKDIVRKKLVLDYAEADGNVNKTCRHFGVTRSNFYLWRNAFRKNGEVGFISRKPVASSHPQQTPAVIAEKVLHLRQTYHLGPIRIVWYLQRYDDIKISCAGVYRILKRNGVSRLPRGTRLRKVHTKRYQKQVPGHQIQVDVKFLTFQGKDENPIKRYQYTAIDDATRVRALKIYERHNQANAIPFIDHVIAKFPFRSREVRTDIGHEFQAKFHWHVEDQGILHAYSKSSSLQLNGKVERSHRSDQDEFYQLLDYTDDINLRQKLAEWEQFYNFSRPHGAFNGKTPYEALREKL